MLIAVNFNFSRPGVLGIVAHYLQIFDLNNQKLGHLLEISYRPSKRCHRKTIFWFKANIKALLWLLRLNFKTNNGLYEVTHTKSVKMGICCYDATMQFQSHLQQNLINQFVVTI